MPTSQRVAISLLILLLASASARAGTTLHVTPDGKDGATGSLQEPLSLPAAMRSANQSDAVTEIVIGDGVYLIANQTISIPKGADDSALATLTIRAANPGKVTLYSAARLTDAQPVAGSPGLFRSTTIPPLNWQAQTPMMWERDTRVRYDILSNKASVAAIPGSAFVDDVEPALYFSTSDGKAPTEHELYLDMSSGSLLYITRSNLIIEGVTFKDHCAIGSVFQTRGHNITIRRCHFDNVKECWSAGEGTTNNVMENCTGIDVANPIHSYAKDIVVRYCRFEKTRDRFMLPIIGQNDTAYHVYSPGAGGVFEYNFSRGYRNGILIKAGTGRYVLNHNTIVDSHWGIEWVTGNQGSDTSYNIVVNCYEPLQLSRFAPDFTSDHNLVWNPGSWTQFGDRVAVINGANRGRHNVLADPRFADPAHGDYRLLPDSTALLLKDGQGAPAGAFGVATFADAAKAPPTVTLAFTADTRRAGRNGERTFDRDPWIGGGTTRIADLDEKDAAPQRITGTTRFTLQPRASDAIGIITTTRLKIGDAPAVETPYEVQVQPTLPYKDGRYPIEVAVMNDRGIWSETARAVVRLERQGPALISPPTIRSNEHGLLVTFRSTKPCFARIDYGSDAAYGRFVESAPLIRRQWNSNDGGEWIETWRQPTDTFAMTLLTPPVANGVTHLRITLTDEVGLRWIGDELTAKLGGAPTGLFVSPAGNDADDGGSEAKPWRSIQFAVDRALPGDCVVLLPGVYVGSTTLNHGGVRDDARITIEAKTPGTVTLDSARREISLLHLERAPFVTVKNLRMLFYEMSGVYAWHSPHLRVEGCQFYNGLGWIDAYHVFCFYSPNAIITRCTAVGGSIAFYFLESPYATVTHNTASQAMFAAAAYTFSARGSVQMNNSFAFAGNDIYTLHAHHPDDFKTFRSDYNNLGTNVAAYHTGMDQKDPAQWALITAESVNGEFPAGFRTVSKAVVGMNERRVLTLKQWREESGQDAHSIFADPHYRMPTGPIDRWDWGVKAGSANIQAGEGGVTIGAAE